jgi:hypothetical protein
MDVFLESIETLCGLRVRADVRADWKKGVVRQSYSQRNARRK